MPALKFGHDAIPANDRGAKELAGRAGKQKREINAEYCSAGEF
jgi:hypothetical protein